ncbi:MAG: cation:dicarboxylase symporter family transporter [Verrucomicrobia bacterium]|nr:cation:dicarboxylase symporter family transporter [Verrucomicrobiota bacterium]
MRLFKMSLTLQMAIATALGILCGFFFGDLCEVFSNWASAYIMLLKVTAVPYLIAAIIHGVGQLSLSQAKMIMKRGILFIGLAWSINICVIYLINYVFPRSESTQVSGYVSTETPHLNFAELLIPDNIFYDLSNNIIPAIVIFSLLIGIALMYLKEKHTLMYCFENLVEALTRITSWIARITPYGTFLIIANQVGTVQLSTVKQVSTYIILYMVGISIIVFWIFPRLIQMLTSIPSYKWLQQLLPILLLAYTTNVVIVCLPYIIELLKKETQILDPKDEKAQSQIQGTVSVVFNLPLGSLFITVFVFFVAIFYNFPLSFGSQIELFVTTFLTSLGAVGLGSWINSLTFILDSLGLPIEAVNIYLTTLPFTAGFQSMLSVMQIASISLFITLSCRQMIILKWSKIIRNVIITAVPVIAVFAGISVFNPLPKIINETKSIYELKISSNIPTTVHKTPSASPISSSESEDALDRILRTKVLKVGYNTAVPPFCFLNVDGNVVGYDIAFAYELAYDLGVDLELVPLNYSKISDELNENLYDIAMAAVTINEQRLKQIVFTQEYISPRIVLIAREEARKLFMNTEKVQESKHAKIAVLKGSSFEQLARELFPSKELVLLKSYDEFLPLDKEVALLWEEQEAIAWLLVHRGYRLILPDPGLGYDTLAYAIRNNSPLFLHYLNTWLALKTTSGYSPKQYDLWIKGKTEIAAPNEPRWSIIRNVLHWVE